MVPTSSDSGIRSKYQISCYLLNSGLGISFLVFINAAQPFILREILHAEQDKVARISSTLIFADELLALAAVLVWGRLADTFSPNLVTAFSNVLVAVALALTTQAKNTFPALLLIRLIFSLGASGITTMLSANLAILQTPQKPLTSALKSPDIVDEEQPLLGWRRPPPSARPAPPANPEVLSLTARKPAALSAFLGIAAGTGALLAVFGYLRIPIWLSDSSTNTAHSLKLAIFIVAGMAGLNALLAASTLPRRIRNGTERLHHEANASDSQHAPSKYTSYVGREVSHIFRGFQLVAKDSTVALACLGGFAARAQTIAVSAFVPVYVASYYFKRGLCDPTSPDELKQTCHEAYALASAVTGSTQLVALVTAVGFVSVTRLPRTLLSTSIMGCLSFLLLGRTFFGPLFGGDNPKNIGTWVAVVGIGIAQTGSVTLSLALVARAREKLLSHFNGEGQAINSNSSLETPHLENGGSETQGHDTAGALAGVYSFSGGLGVLAVSGLSAILSSSTRQGAPFVVISVIDLVLILAALLVLRQERQAAITLSRQLE